MDNVFHYEITENVAVLAQSGGTSFELNFVSYNGKPARLDLRRWQTEGTEKRMLKGVTMSDAEAEALRVALNELAEGGKLQ